MFKAIIEGVVEDFSKFIREFISRRDKLNSDMDFRKLRKDFYTNVIILSLEAFAILSLFVIICISSV